MTNVTRQELEACARLLSAGVEDGLGLGGLLVRYEGDDYRSVFDPEHSAADREALARAAKLIVNYEWMCVELPDELYLNPAVKGCWCWPEDGTEAECIIKAASAVQLEREKQQ